MKQNRDKFVVLCELQEQCTHMCTELKNCLIDERQACISLKWEELLLATSRKEDILRRLKVSKDALRALVKAHYQVESITEILGKLSEDEKSRWEILSGEWAKTWNQTRNWCDANQKLFAHSQRNLGMLVDHLKALFGEKATYSKSGAKVDLSGPGKVLEARY
jgi:hypothetical protein